MNNTVKPKFREYQDAKFKDSIYASCHDWKKTYDLQKEDSPPGSFTSEVITVCVWISSGTNKVSIYAGLFAYAEVYRKTSDMTAHNSFYGESSEDDALRWAMDISNKWLYS